MFDYHQLEALEAVIAHRGFVRAAGALHITQSAISQRIRTLEEQCGTPLLARRNPPELTARGRELVAHVRRVRLMEFELGTIDNDEAETGRPLFGVRIGTNADSLATWLLAALAPLARERGLLFEFIVENEELSYRLLERGEVLGCISARNRPVTGGDAAALGKMEYRCVATPEFVRTYFPDGLERDRVADAPAVLFDMNDQVHERFLKRALHLKTVSFPHHTVPTSHGFVDVIRSGMAYGVAPVPQVQTYLRRRILRDLAPSHRLHIPLSWHYPRRESRIQKELRIALIEAARRSLTEGAPG